MTPDERDALCIGLAKELVAVVQAEHPEVSESVILERIQHVWTQLVSAVVAEDAEMAIAASRLPSLSPAAQQEWASIWRELFALLGREAADEGGETADEDRGEAVARWRRIAPLL